jgi:hypothetical protein
MLVNFTYRNPVGCVYRVRIDGVASWENEPYPPGGFLRVVRDAEGRILAGPLVDELLAWTVSED